MAPFPALARVCGLVVDEGETTNTTLAVAALPSTSAWESASSEQVTKELLYPTSTIGFTINCIEPKW